MMSAGLCLLTSLILTVDLTLGFGSNKDMQFTFLLSAGSTECFYQTTARSGSMEVGYQVNIISSLSSCHCVWHSGGVMLYVTF